MTQPARTYARCRREDGQYQHAPECESGAQSCPIPGNLPLVFGQVEPWAFDALPPRKDLTGFKYIKHPAFSHLFEGKPGSRAMGMRVICSARTEADGKRWIHVSYSRQKRLPDYRDSCLVKSAFIGDDRLALALFPRSSEHVNVHPRCLHLWACLDGDPTPDFRVLGQV